MSANLLREIGYKPKTECWDDLEMTYQAGLTRIKDVFNDLLESCKDDPSGLIELMLVIRYQYPGFQKSAEKLYKSMKEKADNLAEDVLSEDAKKYYELLAGEKSS